MRNENISHFRYNFNQIIMQRIEVVILNQVYWNIDAKFHIIKVIIQSHYRVVTCQQY